MFVGLKECGKVNSLEGLELLTAKELEAILKISKKTIYSYVERGLIPYVRIESNVRFLKPQIAEWIEEHNFRPQKPKRRRRH